MRLSTFARDLITGALVALALMLLVMCMGCMPQDSAQARRIVEATEPTPPPVNPETGSIHQVYQDDNMTAYVNLDNGDRVYVSHKGGVAVSHFKLTTYNQYPTRIIIEKEKVTR